MQLPPVPRIVLYGLAFILGVALVIAAGTSAAAFGAYNIEWDGTSDFRELVNEHEGAQVTLDTRSYETIEANGTVAFVIAPTEDYEANKSQRVQTFVEDGGTLVLAENFGPHGNSLLEDVGADARFDGALLRDERHYYRSPNFPVATNVSDTPYTAGVNQITLNHGTAVNPNGATTVVSTSEFGYLDRDGTREISSEDQLDEQPVVTLEPVGDGYVIVVSDPSIFINVMLEQPDNRVFAGALVDAHQRAIIDYSHADDLPPIAVALLHLRGSTILQLFVGALGVATVWQYARRPESLRGTIWERSLTTLPAAVTTRLPMWIRGPTRARGGSINREEMLASLQRQYPEWTEAQLESMIADVLSGEDKEDDNE